MASRLRFLAFAAIAAAALVLVAGAGGAGELHKSFGDNGLVRTDVAGGFRDVANDILVDSSLRIVAAGFVDTVEFGPEQDWALVRYLADGTLDASFGTGGIVTTDVGSEVDEIEGIVLQANGRILATGLSEDGGGDFTVARYLVDGTLDTSFGGTGIVNTTFAEGRAAAFDVIVQSNGRIVVAGVVGDDFAVARYLPNGSLDTTFDGDGRVVTDFAPHSATALEVTIQSNGRIVLSGVAVGNSVTDMAVARYLPSGALDTSFDGDGKLVLSMPGTESAPDVSMQSNGRILLVGSTTGVPTGADFLVVRLMPNGALDPSFDGDGRAIVDVDGTIDIAFGLVQLGGRIIVAGNSQPGKAQLSLARLTSSGALDGSFGTGGTVRLNVPSGNEEALDVTTQGAAILAGGSSGSGIDTDFALARVLP
jgi:uncharacterized delta-60 repeat protein